MTELLKTSAIAALLLHQAINPASAQAISRHDQMGLGALAAGAAAILLGSRSGYVASTTGTFTLPGARPGANLVTGAGPLPAGPLRAGGAAGVAGAASISGSSQSESSEFFDGNVTDVATVVGTGFVLTTTTTATSTGP
jgi:hypothetical protein